MLFTDSRKEKAGEVKVGTDTVLENIGYFGPHQLYLILITSLAGAISSTQFSLMFRLLQNDQLNNFWCPNINEDQAGMGNRTLEYCEKQACSIYWSFDSSAFPLSWIIVIDKELTRCVMPEDTVPVKALYFVTSGVGTLLCGLLADKFGRKRVLIITMCLEIMFQLLTALSTNLYQFVILRALAGTFVFSNYCLSFVLAMEFLPPGMRPLSGVLHACYMDIFAVFYAVISTKLADWRHIYCITAGLNTLVVILIYFRVSESPRFLLNNHKVDQAFKIFRRIAKSNKVEMESSTTVLKVYQMAKRRQAEIEEERETDEKLQEEVERQQERDCLDNQTVNLLKNIDDNSTAAKQELGFRLTEAQKQMVIITAELMAAWIIGSIVFWDLITLNYTFGTRLATRIRLFMRNYASKELFNAYLHFQDMRIITILFCSIMIFRDLIVLPTANKLSRRVAQTTAQTIFSFCLLANHFASQWKTVSDWELKLTETVSLALIGFATTVKYIRTCELSPTTLRCTILGVCVVCGRMGSIFFLVIKEYFSSVFLSSALAYIFPLIGLIGVLPAIYLPDTTNTALKESLH